VGLDNQAVTFVFFMNHPCKIALILLLVVVHPTMFYSSIPQVLTLLANSKYMMMMMMMMNMRTNFATKNCSAKLILHALNDYPEYQMIL
jgi:hypothetical protein